MPDTLTFAAPLPTVSGVTQPVRRNKLAVREDASEDLRRLVLRAKTGDADAFGTLYDRYLDLVYRYIYFRVGPPAGRGPDRRHIPARAKRRSAASPGRDVTSARGSSPSPGTWSPTTSSPAGTGWR